MTSSILLRTVAWIAVVVLAGCPSGPAEEDAGTDAGSRGEPADAGMGLDDDAGVPLEPLSCGELPSGVTEGREGAPGDSLGSPTRTLVLMGGSVEVDPASRLFVEAAGGGDVLVLRASGAVDTYTPYFFEELMADPGPASSSTLRLDDGAASSSEAVRCRVEGAEALFFAGGDQWDYLSWSPSLHDAVRAPRRAGAAIGGTSAGAMVLGEHAFWASEGSVSSEEALNEPLASFVAVGSSGLAQPELLGFLVDTHFTAREREGRLLTFLARALDATGAEVVWGLGLDERAALVIHEGDWQVLTTFDDRAVWLYEVRGPATLQAGSPLGLEGVRRFRLGHGASGTWPPDVSDLEATPLQVTAGTVSTR